MSTRPYLGINVNAASVDEMHYRGLLEEGETLLALFDGVLLDENRRRVGGLALADFVALTDLRVITWARGFFNDTVDSFVWRDVDVVQAETWDPWHGRVQLAFRLPPVAPRKRRIAVNGSYDEPGNGERLIINTLDYMPADDVATFARMVELIGDNFVAGVGGDDLITAFAAEFPVVEREPLQPFFTAPEPAPPPAVEQPEAPAERRRWWQLGRAGEAELEPQPTSPGNLIAAYERARGGAPAGSGTSAMPQPGPVGPLPTLPEQPSMYEVSRSLRLFLEAPRRLAKGLRRATDMVGGAGELVQGLQDPRVRRNAMRGLYHTAAQHEAEGGPLAPVGPVVRAAVRFAEPLEDGQPEQQSRRIQVRATVRKAPTPVETEGVAEPQRPQRQGPPPAEVAPPAAEPAARPDPVRRSISVRRVDMAPPQAPEPAPVEPPRPAPEQGRVAPVRRIAVGRAEPVAMSIVPDPEARAQRVAPQPNGNGAHKADESA